MSASKDTSNVPKWLEARLFEGVLKENVPNYKEIKEFKAYAGLPAGENYSTVITRIEIDAELQGEIWEGVCLMLKQGTEVVILP